MATLTLTAAATAAARFLHILDSGESLSTQMIADALEAANDMLSNWSIEQLMIMGLSKISWNLVAGTQGYTIGPAQTINVTRPQAFASASFQNSAGPGGPVKVCSVEEWEATPDRQMQSNIIRRLFYDRGTPTGNVYVSPVPLGSTLSVDAFVWSPIGPFADATTPLTLPDASYARLIKLGLAIEIAPQYSMQPDPDLVKNFNDVMARVRQLNAELVGNEPPHGDSSADSGRPIAPNMGAQ